MGETALAPPSGQLTIPSRDRDPPTLRDKTRRYVTKLYTSLGLTLAWLTSGQPVSAAPPEGAVPQEDFAPVEEPGAAIDGEGEQALDTITWLPRQIVEQLVRAQSAAARFVHDEQLVPRYEQLLAVNEDVNVIVFPTLFAETNRSLSVGARAYVETKLVATQARLGFGGPRDWVAEGAVQLAFDAGFPLVLNTEATAIDSTRLPYLGLGADPARDVRNAWQPGLAGEEAVYDERRRRIVTSVGLRLGRSTQLLVSTSLDHRRIDESVEGGLDQTYIPDSVPTWDGDTWRSYGEVAVRYDSRPRLAPPVEGFLAELYGGYGGGLLGPAERSVRLGGRVAGSLPIYRRTNILTPAMTIDQVIPLDASLPFTELATPLSSRADDERRDESAVVVSLDYQWQLASFMGARLFADASMVGSDPVRAFGGAPEVGAGLGFDFYTRRYAIAGVRAGYATTGLLLGLYVGDPQPWGDRQRRP